LGSAGYILFNDLFNAPRSASVPFRDAGNGLILVVDLKINGKLSTMLVDSGSSITFYHATDATVELMQGRFMALRAEDSGKIGMISGKLPKNFPHIDGILGEDFLRYFASVRINYKANLIEFEK